MSGQDHLAITGPTREGEHGSQVRDARAEPLEGGAHQPRAGAGDDVVAPGVELQIGDAGRVEVRRQRPDERLPGGERGSEPVHPDESGAPATPRLGHHAVEPDAVTRADARERDGEGTYHP